LGQITTTTDPTLTVTQYGDDAPGNQTFVVRDFGSNRLNQVTSMSYSVLGDVIAVTDRPRGLRRARMPCRRERCGSYWVVTAVEVEPRTVPPESTNSKNTRLFAGSALTAPLAARKTAQVEV
jgi:hypothetical protein